MKIKEHKKYNPKETVPVYLFDFWVIVEQATRNNSHLLSKIKYWNPIGQKKGVVSFVVVPFPTISFSTRLNCCWMCATWLTFKLFWLASKKCCQDCCNTGSLWTEPSLAIWLMLRTVLYRYIYMRMVCLL